MANLQQLFEIDNFTLYDKFIEVELSNYEFDKIINIPRAKFECWLKHEGRLEWTMDYSDHTGEHIQKTGIMDIDEYWDCNTNIETDLYDYIIEKMIDSVKIFQSIYNF